MSRPRARALALAALCLLVSLPARAQARGPGDPKALYAEALGLMSAGETYRAIDALSAALDLNPGYADAWAAMAQCQYDLGEYERAASFVREAEKYGPRSPSLLTLEGFCLIGGGKLDEARKLFDEAAARLPNDRDARFGLALLDLRRGRTVDAKARLAASLRAVPTDPRALVSLALIAKAEGKADESAAYLAEALRWAADDPDVCYAAATLSAENGDAVEAARLARSAIEARPAFSEARNLLSSLYYDSGELDEARAVLDQSLRYDRKDSGAWFLLGLVEAAAGRRAEAEYALSTLVAMKPDDECARLVLENLVMDGTSLEDPARATYAAWRFDRAADFEKRLLYDKAMAEYRRGLSIDPYSNKGRRRYAELLRMGKLSASFLSELRFIDSLGKGDQALADAIEIYGSLLEGSVSRDWDVDELSLTARPYRIAVFSIGPGGTPYHSGSDMTVARYLRDCLASSPQLSLDRGAPRVGGYADAYRIARESGADYFVIVRVAETDRDVLVSAELRASRSGAVAVKVDAPRSGNDRIAAAVGRIASAITVFLPTRGTVLRRSADTVLSDLGRVDGAAVGDSFLIVRSGGVSVRPDGQGIAWKDADVGGRFVITRIDDETSEGRLERAGFFDRVNPGDQLVREPPAPADAAGATGATTSAGAAATGGAKPAATPEPASTYVWSALFERVRSLY